MVPFGDLIQFFAVFFLIVVVLSVISEMTYRGRTAREVRQNIRAVLLRALILTVVTLTAFFVYQWLGLEGSIVKRSP